MKAKKIAVILVSILILTILLVLIMAFLLFSQKNSNEKEENIIENEVKNELSQNNISINNQNGTENLEGMDFDPELGMDIFSEEEMDETRPNDIYSVENENGQENYTEEDINNFDFEVKEIPEDIISGVVDKDKIIFEIKKYIYENPQITATEAVYKESRYINQENRTNVTFFSK